MFRKKIRRNINNEYKKKNKKRKKKLRNINLFLKAEQSCFWDGNTDGK